jgi:glycosyltransferase involved in cell wall biosynthesis
MAAGRPVVCLDIGGPAAQVTSETGFVAPVTAPSAAIEAISAFLTLVDADRSRLARMSEAARLRARREFSTRKVGSVMRSLYAEAIEEHRFDQRLRPTGTG